MLDMSTIDAIPTHLHRALSIDSKKISLQEVVKALITQVALECGFVSSNFNTNSYSYTWYYSFDHQVFEDCIYNSFDSCQNMIFKFVMDQRNCINVTCHLVCDLAIVSAYEECEENLSNVLHCESLAFPISRYIPFKKLCTPIASSFRNLKELSFKLKQHIFHPLRNDIYRKLYLIFMHF